MVCRSAHTVTGVLEISALADFLLACELEDPPLIKETSEFEKLLFLKRACSLEKEELWTASLLISLQLCGFIREDNCVHLKIVSPIMREGKNETC